MTLQLSGYIYRMRFLFVGLGLVLGVSTTGFADDHIYQFAFPKLHSSAAERARIHQWIALGKARFKGNIFIPAYGISIENPVSDGIKEDALLKDFTSCQPKACNFNFTLNAAQAQQLALYQVEGLGWFLAPRHWNTIEASMGPSGIAALVMFSPDAKQYLSMDDSSACVGCALSSASLFFKTAQQEAKKNEFWFYSGSNVPVNTVHLKTAPDGGQTALYHYQLASHYPSDGVAKFTGMQADIVNFRRMTVSLNPKDKALAQAMLNFYLFSH